MSREDFIASQIDEYAGMLLDAAVAQRTGADLALWIRMAYGKLKSRLGASYDVLRPPVVPEPKPAPANGTPAQTPKKVQ